MIKPRIWWFNGKWWCGTYIGRALKVPVARSALGYGDSPSEAYKSWVRDKWQTGRIHVTCTKPTNSPFSFMVVKKTKPKKNFFWRLING